MGFFDWLDPPSPKKKPYLVERIREPGYYEEKGYQTMRGAVRCAIKWSKLAKTTGAVRVYHAGKTIGCARRGHWKFGQEN